MIFDWLFQKKPKKSSEDFTEISENIQEEISQSESENTYQQTNNLPVKETYSDMSSEQKYETSDVAIESKTDNSAIDNPFSKSSELKPLKNQEIQQDIPVHQVITSDDKEDYIPFGMSIMENESLQNEEPELSEKIPEYDKFPDNNGNISIIPDFSAVSGIIIHNKTGKIFNDVSIDALSLSLRAFQALKRGGISTVADLIRLNTNNFIKIRNFGKKLQQEVLEALSLYLNKKISEYPSTTNGENNYISCDLQEILSKDAELINLNPLVENMLLTVRAKNCLRKNGIYDLKTLLETTPETLLSFSNLGKKTLDEIIAYKEKNKFSPLLENEWENKKQFIAEKREIELKKIEIENKYKLKDMIFNKFYSNSIFTFKKDTIYDMLKDWDGIEAFDCIMNELLDEGKIEMTDTGTYKLRCIPVMEYVRTEMNESEQIIQILQERINGKTLEAIAESYCLTRERIRQHQNKILRKINKKCQNTKQILHEECFRYLFEHYNISEDLFCEITQEPPQTYRYLDISGNKGNEELDNIWSDVNIPEFIKLRWEHFLRCSPKSSYIYIDDGLNRRIKKERSEIEKYILSEIYEDELTIEEFVKLYNNFLNEHGLSDEKKLQLSETDMRARENHFAKCEYVLYKLGRKLRYYPVHSKDYNDMFEAINLGQYHDTEISTLKFFRQYPNIMEQYDIRDEYELHNLLKKIGIDKENSTAVFSKMPYIKFGTFNRDAMIKEKLFEHAPISSEALAEIISEEHGYQPTQIMAWFDCIREYFHDGMFSVNYVPLPEEHVKMLKAELTDDFYYINEIKEIYSRLVPEADEELISSFNLKRMGFVVNSSYVIQNFSSVKKYFEHLLTVNDTVDITPIYRRFSKLCSYYNVLQNLSDSMQIIEYEPHNYIHIRRLQKLGITEKNLQQYCEAVFEYVESDTYFTVEALRKSGFTSDLDNLGFKSWFYSSVLRIDKRFHFIKLGGTVLFYKGDKRPELRSFLSDILACMKSVEFDTLLKMSEENYGIKLDKDRVRYAISDTGLYYDSSMEMIYQDYDTYYHTIAGISD